MMDETEYIHVTNRVKVSLMLHILRDILPDEQLITTADQHRMRLQLARWQDALFTHINREKP